MKKSLFIVVILGLIVGGWKLIASKQEALSKAPIPSPTPLHVKVSMPKKGSLSPRFNAVGTLKPEKTLTLIARFGGHVEKIYVSEGAFVTQGTPLVQMDTSELESKIATLQFKQEDLRMQHANALLEASIWRKKDHSNGVLFEAGALSKEARDESALVLDRVLSKLTSLAKALAQLEAEQEALRQSRSYYTIIAPMDGVIEKKMVEVGEISAPSKPLLQLSSRTKVLEVLLNPNQSVALGDTLEMEGIKTSVGKILPLADRFQRKIESMPFEHSLPSGVLMDVVLWQKAQEGSVIPSKALYAQRDKTYVMLHKEGRFHKEPVTLLASTATCALIQEPLDNPVALAHPSKLSQLIAYEAVDTQVVSHESHCF